MPQLTQRQIATHEVGHAVVAAALGKRFDLISIIPDDGGPGRVESPRCEPEPKRDLAIALAGIIAQQMADSPGQPLRLLLNFPFDELDIRQALHAADLLVDDEDVPRQLNLGVLRAMGILDRSWDTVEVLVQALLQRRELPWREAVAMIEEDSSGLRTDELATVFALNGGDGFTVAVVPANQVVAEHDPDHVLVTLGSELQ